MKLLRIIFMIYLGLLISGCKPDKDTFQNYPRPDWTVQSSQLYPYSFTAIVCLPPNINAQSQDSDIVAAFINDECRGVGNLVKSDDGSKRVYFITVRGAATENRDIVFKYYNARLSFLYQAKTTVLFSIDGTYGSYDFPIELDLELL